MNPFAALALQLSANRTQAKACSEYRPGNGGITDRIRRELGVCGPQTSRELADKFDLPVSRISALLNNDLVIGRIIKSGGHYELSQGFAEAAPEVEAAKQLLRANGYAVFRSVRSSRGAS
jgi:hypothetical protein